MYKTMTVLYCLMLVLCGHSYKIEHDNSNSEQPELQENLILKLELKPLSDNILNEDETTVSRVKRSCLSKLFNVSCYKYCPKTKTNDWTYLEAYHSCQNKYNWSTFHCAKNEFGKFVEACAKSVICHIGEEPIIYFVKDRKIYAKIKCEPCSSGRYNPNEAMISYDYSQCPKVRRECVPSLGLIECGESGISERTWTDRKCRCNIRDNYLPHDDEPNKCTDDYSFRCYDHPPCQVTSDGKEQEYLSSNYSCAPKCGDGFYPRTLDTDECIPIPTIDSNTTDENITGSTVEATTHGTTTNTTRQVTETTNAIVTVTVTHGTKGTKEEPVGLSTGEIVGICVGGVFGLVLLTYLLVGISYYFCIYKRKENEDRGCLEIFFFFVVVCCWLKMIQKSTSSQTENPEEGSQMLPNPSNGVSREDELTGQHVELPDVQTQQGITASQTENPEERSQMLPNPSNGVSRDDELTGQHVELPDVQTQQGITGSQTENPEEGSQMLPNPSNGVSREEERTGQSVALPDEQTQQGNTAEQTSQHVNLPEWLKQQDHRLNEGELSNIAEAIGQNWRLLGLKLEITNVELDRIEADNRNSIMQIYGMLLKWKNQQEDGASLKALICILETAEQVSINWDIIQTFVDTLSPQYVNL